MTTSVRSVADMNADSVKFRGVGIAFSAAAGTTTIYDYKFLEARLVDGIIILAKDKVFGDHISISIVDVDNIIGYGAGVVLDTFASSWYLGDTIQTEVRLPYSAELLAGLYMRLSYLSTGASVVSLNCNLFAHKYMR